MYNTNCGCTTSALQVLMRLEQLGATSAGLEAALEVMENVEVRCLAVLNCAACRQRRFPLSLVTVISTTVVEWLQKPWFQDGATNGTNNAISLGDYDLEPADAKTVLRELMGLQLLRLSEVLDKLKGVLSVGTSMSKDTYNEVVSAQLTELRNLRQRINALTISDIPEIE